MICERPSAPTILLVDDELRPLELPARMMTLWGFSVVTADGPMKAISIMGREAIEVHVAVLDYNMPGMNGCLLAERLRSMIPEPKTILYSSAIDIPSREATSIDVVISRSDGIEMLISQVTQFVQASVDSQSRLAGRQYLFSDHICSRGA